MPPSTQSVEATKAHEYETLKQKIHNKLVDKIDLTKVGDLQGDVLRREIRMVVEHLCDSEGTMLEPQRTGSSDRGSSRRNAWLGSARIVAEGQQHQ